MTLQRDVEAAVGGALLKMALNSALKKSKLVEKSIYLPKHDVHMHYLEREAISESDKQRKGLGLGSCFHRHDKSSAHTEATSFDTQKDVPTIIICHGLSDSAKNMAGFIHSLDIPHHVRILAPDQIGHGKDLERAKLQPETYEHPTQLTMLDSTIEFLDAVKVGSNTNAFGISLGGGLAYYLRLQRPEVIQKTVLVSPAIPYCIDQQYMDDFVSGKKNFMCFENRQDVKHLFRDLSTGQENNDTRAKKDPVPTFFLEAIYRLNKNKAPEDHYREMLHGLLDKMEEAHASSRSNVGSDVDDDNSNKEDDEVVKMFTADRDIDKQSPRLVLWPDQDRIISHENGKHFFQDSLIQAAAENNETANSGGGNTRFETVPDCGHVFHADGTAVLAIEWVRVEIRDYLMDFA